MREYMKLIEMLLEAVELGNVEGQMSVGPVNYDQRYGIGAVPDNQNVKYKGFACFMLPRQFLSLAEVRHFSTEHSNINGIWDAIKAGKPIGSPFLDVLFDGGNVPVVRQHEGRTRMAAIANLYPEQPVMVHVFASGGQRARHLSLDHIRHFQEIAIPEKKKLPLIGPHCGDEVWWLDGWKNLI